MFFIKVTITYQTLDILQEHGIAANDIQKLNDAGYHTVGMCSVDAAAETAELLQSIGPKKDKTEAA